MATGSISSLGVGSGLQLQDIIDQLRQVDEQLVEQKKDRIADLETQLDEFTVVNNKLLTMKSVALTLSLSSTFLGRTASSSSESVLTATVNDGAPLKSGSVTVTQLAQKSSWRSAGVASKDAIVYVPTSRESDTGVTDSAADVMMAEGEAMTITYGSSQTITITAPVGGWTMDDVVNEINTVNVDNQGGPGANGRYVTAETYTVGSETFLRVKTDVAGGTGEANRVVISETVAGMDFAAPKETFSFKVGSDTNATSIAIAADTTLSELVDLINDDAGNPGVTASIIDDGAASNPYRLILQANDTGEENRITEIDWQLPDITLSELQGAGGASLNAQFSVDGIDYERQTNTIDDVWTAVTFHLESVGTSTVAVESNDASITELITSLVTAYNDAVQEISSQTGYDAESGTSGNLASTTLRDLPYDLQNLMTSTIRADADGTITTLFDLGLQFERDGTISIDQEALQAAVAADPEGVQALFLGDADAEISGLADLVNERLRVITGGTGQIEAEKSAAQLRIDDLELRIETETARLDKKYELLAQQFIELDRYMNQMTSISDYLTSQFDSLGQMWGSTGNKQN